MTLPLGDIRVVEAHAPDCPLALRLASGLAGRILADLGATVIKIEPPDGDPVRRLPPFVGDDSAVFAFLNAGKRSVVLKDGDQRSAMLARLVAQTDAAIVDAGLQRTLVSDKPIVALSLFGGAAAADAAGTEFTVLARAGLLDIVGDPQRQPLRLGGHQAAYAAGLAAYTGLMAALPTVSAPQDGPVADTVHISLLETAIWLNWKSAATAATSGTVTSRAGRRANWPIVRCADGWIALVYQEPDWPGLKALVGDARLDGEDFATQAGRNANAEAFLTIVEQGLGRMTRAEIKQAALGQRLPLGPVWQVHELLDDPQLLARQFLASVTLGGGTPVRMPRVPVIWNGRVFDPGLVPALGAGQQEAVL